MQLKTKLLVYLTVPVVVAVFISAYIIYLSSSTAMRTVIKNDIKTSSFFIAENLDLTLSDIRNSFFVLSRTHYFKNARDKQNQNTLVDFFKEAKNAMTSIKDIFLLDMDGNVVCSLNAEDTGKNYSDRQYFIKAMQGKLTMDGPLISRVSHKQCVYIAIPVSAEDEICVLVASIELDTIVDICFDSDVISPMTDIFLLNNTGKVLAAKNDEDNPKATVIALERAITPVIREHEQGFLRFMPENEWHTGYFKQVENLNWVVFVAMSDSRINMTALSSSQHSLLFTMAAVAVGLMIASALIYSALKALGEIVHYAQTISTGDLSNTLNIQRNDELGQLATSLRSMVTILKNDKDRLNSLVEERTRQLNESQKSLFQESSLLRAVLNTVPDLIFYKDMDGVYRGCNTAFCEFVGHDLQNIVGKNDIELFHITENNAQDFIDDDRKVFSGELSTLVREEEITYPDGRRMFIETIKSLYYSEDNAPCGMVGISRNIQLRKETESAHAEAIQRACEASTAKSEFVARISHEIRTPLNAILGMNYLLKQICDTPNQQDYLHKIEVSAKNLLAILNDVLDFSKIEAGKLEIDNNPFSVRDMVHDLVAMNENIASSAGLAFDVALDSRVPDSLVGDRMRISQVLLNLISNAIKFSHKGTLRLRVEVQEEREDEVCLLFSVQDEGIGMSQSQISKLFTAFTQVDGSTTRKYGGTGLGLSICKRLVELMGGNIWAESLEGQGSTFSFRLCLKHDEKGCPLTDGSGDTSDCLQPPASLHGKKILLVEDNLINQEIAKEILTLFGVEVEIAENGCIAVEKVRNSTYSLVLMDIQMPVMDGYQASRIIREDPRFSTLPIVAMTANVMSTDREACFEAGMNEHLSKPFEPEVLKRVLERCCQ